MQVSRIPMRIIRFSLVVILSASPILGQAEDDLSVIFEVDNVETELIEELPLAAAEDVIPITTEPITTEMGEAGTSGSDFGEPANESLIHDAPRGPAARLTPEDSVPTPTLSPVDGTHSSENEVVRERYPNRRVKVERQVTQDEHDNYVNHGTWKMWDPQGNLIVEGEYRFGQRHGTWSRWYRPNETKLLSTPPFDQFHGPFISQASFVDGKLDGRWIIYDTKQRKICDWEFANGRRHGTSAWWYSNGKKMRQIAYVDGEINGLLQEWNRSGEVVTEDKYDHGRRLAMKTETFKNGQKQSEGLVLHARLVVKDVDNWENCTIATYTQEGEDEKHGSWITWFVNGQRKVHGEYRHNKPVNAFVWWHDNGQKSLQAFYEHGKQHGTWTWWHENGQKSIQGNYGHGAPTGRWTWWHQTGKVAQRADFTDSKGRIVTLPDRPDNGSDSYTLHKPVEDRIRK